MAKEAFINRTLPEQYARLYDPAIQKFETPLNQQGIADIDAMFELAMRTYPEDLSDIDFNDRNIHHVYWTAEWWRQYANSQPLDLAWIIHKFRHSTPQLAYVPKAIHSWIEEIMEPPPPPSIEVMDRRNMAWEAASILLKNVVLLDKARKLYDANKDNVRVMYGDLKGLTSRHNACDEMYITKTDREYWLSELNDRLESWRSIGSIIDVVPEEERFISEAKLVSVRALGRRIHSSGAILPAIPADFAA